MREFVADLHIHTCLSPCADLLMSPGRIVEEATKKGLDVIAITDHNSARNCEATLNAALNKQLTVWCGIEITSQEEVHLVALFDNLSAVQSLQKIIYQNLPGENSPEIFGEQLIVNASDEIEQIEEKFLAGAVMLPLNEIIRLIHEAGGIAIAAHIDRERNSLIKHLGILTEDMEFDAVEMYDIARWSEVKPFVLRHIPIIQSSDAHYLTQVGSLKTHFWLKEPSLSEVKMAFNNEGGRKILYPPSGVELWKT